MTDTYISAVVAVAGIIGSVFTLGWWLSGRFRLIEQDAHIRHLENLDRFRRIGLALVRLGSDDDLEPR